MLLVRLGEWEARRQMRCELARLNTIKLEFWKTVRLPSDEHVDITVVKWFPQVLFLF